MFVSHDIDEAVKMADKIAIFRAGQLEQFDSAEQPARASGQRLRRRFRRQRPHAEAAAADQGRRRDDGERAERARRGHAGHRDRAHGRCTAQVSIVMVGPRGRARGMIRIEQARDKKGTVGEHVEALPGVVNIKEDLRTAVSMMFTHDVTWLACVDDDGFYKGYVTQRSITQLLGETYNGWTGGKLSPCRPSPLRLLLLIGTFAVGVFSQHADCSTRSPSTGRTSCTCHSSTSISSRSRARSRSRSAAARRRADRSAIRPPPSHHAVRQPRHHHSDARDPGTRHEPARHRCVPAIFAWSC